MYIYLYQENWFKSYKGGEGGLPCTNLGQGIDFPTVILSCLCESFKLIQARFSSPSNNSNSLNITIPSFDSNNL